MGHPDSCRIQCLKGNGASAVRFQYRSRMRRVIDQLWNPEVHQHESVWMVMTLQRDLASVSDARRSALSSRHDAKSPAGAAPTKHRECRIRRSIHHLTVRSVAYSVMWPDDVISHAPSSPTTLCCMHQFYVVSSNYQLSSISACCRKDMECPPPAPIISFK